jgi:hypothetical protein
MYQSITYKSHQTSILGIHGIEKYHLTKHDGKACLSLLGLHGWEGNGGINGRSRRKDLDLFMDHHNKVTLLIE